MERLQTELERYENIEIAAYYLWEQRGCPFGSPEVDWFRAEEGLQAQSDDVPEEPAMVAMARAMGAVLGSVAGLMASAGSPTHSDETS